MDVSKCSMQLLEALSRFHELPEETLELLRHSSNTQYLDTLSELALNPTFTTTVFAIHEPIFVELCSRWLSNSRTDDISALAGLARVLPSAPHLSAYVRYLLNRRRGLLSALASLETTALHELPPDILGTILLALCRIIGFDNEAFASAISPVQLQVLLHHTQPYIRYLAIKLLCLYLHVSDAAQISMIKSYIGEIEVPGPWEDKTVDYTFYSLWEQDRLINLDLILQQNRKARLNKPKSMDRLERVLHVEDFSATTACIAGVLIPQLDGKDPGPSSLVMTETTRNNMHHFADAVKLSKPVLVTGCSGAGKTSIIRDVARELGKCSSMVTLHLNSQSDAKLLIGMYTSAKTPGSFSWSPGVLTTAVMEGRWLVIEDIDRAPTEILSTLLPLLEHRELYVPTWGKSIQAAPGFKLIATVRSNFNIQGEEIISKANMIGTRHWSQVALKMVPDNELSDIVINRFPLLNAYISTFMNVYRTLSRLDPLKSPKSTTKSITSRSYGPQDLLRWCGRVQDLLSSAGIAFANEAIPVALQDNIFLEAVDSFVGADAPGSHRADGIEIIAQNLHVPAERVRYCLETRKPVYRATDSELHVGRATLPKRRNAPGAKLSSNRSKQSSFAITNHVVRILESIAVAIKQAEPCLLVGETGTGKTAVVQQLADVLNHKLTVVNLSQQSEVGDLLGGYKPLNLRALAVPMKEEFDELLELTFTTKRNQRYVEALGKSVSKGQWTRSLTLWQEALRMIEEHLEQKAESHDVTIKGPRSKRRKLQSPKLQVLKSRWENFASAVKTFQQHLGSGSKGFAFSFVEGNIVKAARNGDWVLLDEINLASPDTLESLADLLSQRIDGGPSILLTESGDTERIYAHKDFRIFGAMNPATDIGKCNLPMGIRSRFTEFYVEAPDNDLNNLVPLIETYLGSHYHIDVRAAKDISQLYLEVKRLANGNQLVDGAKQKPHFSLRTLTRTLVYVVDIAPLYGLRRAIFEGFSMSFLTSLDKESELLLQPLIDKHILAGHKNSRALLHQTPHEPQDGHNYLRFKHYWILRGAGAIGEQDHYIITPFIERNLLNLVRATSSRKFPVLLQGPTSSGKTSMVEYLAQISGNSFVRINNHEHTDLQEYFGSYVSRADGRLEYQEGVLVQALRQGHWVVLDELNLAPTDVLEALNRLLDDNRELLIPETQQLVTPHKNFMLFATQNPAGVYGGRKVLSRAFRNRFLELHFDDIPESELETILRERSKIAPSFCNKIVAVYKELSRLRQSERLFEQKNSFATLRDLFRWASREADLQEQLAINGFLLLAERVRNQEERSLVKKVIQDVMKVPIDESKLYNAVEIKNKSPLGVVWTKSMRRLYVLVTEALKNNEPVLLIGETGSGKTTVCQIIADITDTKLHVVNAHQNMETGDLIGAQRPVRDRTHAETQLAQHLKAVLRACDAYDEDHEHDISTLLECYEVLQRKAPAVLSNEMRFCVEQSSIKANLLFEWADGSLVHAMRGGEHFLLDEISLADDSVLERLNSVLEPGRTLFLAEKGTTDASVKAAPGFQFLATMNPGGDYGKRELSPALRNRFTEIWVPTASSEEEALEIVQAKLTPRLSHFSRPMVIFAAWYAATYNAAAPHLSIRDLLSWVQFVNVFECSDPRFALLHGAAMNYVDGLGANPASKLATLESDVSVQRQVCLVKLDETFGLDLSTMYFRSCRLYSTNDSFSIGPFGIAKAIGSRVDIGYSLAAPTTMANAMKIARALQLSKPILLEGSPGVGKTTLVAALAQAIGMPLTRINLSDQTDLMDLFGSDVPMEGADAGNFMWRDAPFLRAMQRGEWVLLDEMNLASQSVLEGLNACLDHRGQVYVSELNHTFEKHPNFVVFAAQNPHHQGGGRKGLPGSFVNRFTIVYADRFNDEDMITISSELFPNIPSDAREKVLHSVTALSREMQVSRPINAHGGPWEINLRDVLRWLHLLSADSGILPLASAADFQRLLFLQRFRSAEDVAAVSKVLQLYLPRDQTSTYFQGKCGSHLEIGLGVLPRDLKLHSSRIQLSQGSKINLGVAESVMLCVQNKWPCLLVGESGSGKSNIIQQLATMVGADVREICLHSEMDTLDLVGGYEQMVPQRAVGDFLRRLHMTARSDLISSFMSADELRDPLAVLETSLRLPAVPLAKVLEITRIVAERDGSAKYNDYIVECENLIALGMDEKRARFEWVDGVLVKAAQQGKWVILDNANLCNSSVLDRLNSLLEPDGFLSINEHRDADGSAHVVRPHRNFRLFMTMDPRHGELSRAMRNRSVELFIPNDSLPHVYNFLHSYCESSVSRFGLFQAFDWDNMDQIRFNNVVSFCCDHLTFRDLKVCSGWEAQVMKGLVNLNPSKKSLLLKTTKAYRMVFGVEKPISKAISHTYRQLGARMLRSASAFESMQTIYPFNNPILLSATAQNPSSSNLRWLGSRFELLLNIHSYIQDLTSIGAELYSKDQSSWSWVERSMANQRNGRFHHDRSQHLAVFLRDMASYLQSAIEGEILDSLEDRQETLLTYCDVFYYIRDFFDCAHSANLDEGVFQAYQAIGRSLCDRADPPRRLTSDLLRELDARLDALNPSWQLRSGLGMDSLWRAFRPTTAGNLAQLDFSLLVKGLADRFDAVKWRSGASVRELETLQNSILRMHSVFQTTSCPEIDPLDEIQITLESLESQSTIGQVEMSPYFQSDFEVICQYDACQNPNTSTARSMLRLLAGRLTAHSMHFGVSSVAAKVLSQLNDMTAMGYPDTELSIFRNILPISLLRKLEGLSEVPLRSLELLCTELDSVAQGLATSIKAIQKKPLDHLYPILRELGTEVRQALGPQSHKDIVRDIQNHMDQLLQRLGAKPLGEVLSNEASQHLRLCIAETIDSQTLDSLWASRDQSDDILGAAAHCVRYFTGCLLLYLPDRCFDPALKPIMCRTRHNKRKAELRNKIQALRESEYVFSGQTSSFRIQLAEQNLESLGAEPEVPSIVRPQVSELGQLQAEFNNILSTIVVRSPGSSTLQLVYEGQPSKVQEVKLLRANIAQAARRLSQGFHAYDDITRPLIAMLQGLDVGLGLSLLPGYEMELSNDTIKQLCDNTPFLGGGPHDITKLPLSGLPERDSGQVDPRLLYLDRVAVARSVGDDLEAASVDTIAQAFHSLYEEWKERLSHDQLQNATNSSLYRYRGKQEDNDDALDQDFLQLFPNYIDASEHSVEQIQSSNIDPRDQARSLAQVQREIFQDPQTTSKGLIRLLRDTSKNVAGLRQYQSSIFVSPVPARKMLPALLLCLQETKDHLHGKTMQGNRYNFYTDANLAEAQRLIALVRKIQIRFGGLQGAWPDHATLGEVLKTSSELLALRHTEPIAKLLTKTEQLHNYVHEWQTLASKQYTATTLYDQLTELLVNWRRLELSTWARLLDMEDQKCSDDADTWWFVAYEVIVAAPLSMIHAGEDVHGHAEQLFSTLADFVTTASMGQYTRRLGMISCFKCHLDIFTRNVPSMGVVYNAITNFLSYYTRFETNVQDALREGRQVLEKDIKEILLLASWKDTNINAMRDSAKRSHNKLFKIVRKYRTLLAQPAETIIAQGIPEKAHLAVPSMSSILPADTVDPRALQVCQQNLPTWQTKRERFTKPTTTATRMFQMIVPSFDTLNPASYLDSFGTELIESIRAFQKETPTNVTKENVDVIKHLKARKRKLFADTLKSLRQMGFRSNVSADALAKQASTAAILTHSACLPDKWHQSDIEAARYHFHKTLCFVPLAKERARTHSEDLTHGEVSRSIGYLESMMSVILRQRTVLASAIADLDGFKKTIETMKVLWDPDSGSLRHQDCGTTSSAREIRYILRWLPPILETGSFFVETHGKLGGTDLSTIREILGGWKDTIEALGNSINKIPEASLDHLGLTSVQYDRALAKAESSIQSLDADLRGLMINNPEMSYIFEQLALWSDLKGGSSKQHLNGAPSIQINALDEGMSRVVDSILVAVQRMQESIAAMPKFDDAAWLIHTDHYQGSNIKDMRVAKVNKALDDTISMVRQLDPVEGASLDIAGAICAMSLPIIEQYRKIHEAALQHHLKFHGSLCKLSSILAQSFTQIAMSGFCSPAEDSTGESGKTEKLEGGTGLGEGEGADDISKDIDDDEDLSELAQKQNKDPEREETDDQEDAVNMDRDEMEGELGDGSDRGDSDGSATECGDDDIEEEMGSVDELDATAVDEKLWNGEAEGTNKEKEASKLRREIERDEQMAADSAAQQAENADQEDDENNGSNDEGADDGEEIAKAETEKMDPHTQEGQNLDLPEDMDLDNINGSETEPESEASDMDGITDVEQDQVSEDTIHQEVSDDLDDRSDAAGEAQRTQPDDPEEADGELNDIESEGSPVDTMPGEDAEMEEDNQSLLNDRLDDSVVDPDNAAPSDVRGLDGDMEQEQGNEKSSASQARSSKGTKGRAADRNDPGAVTEDGQIGSSDDRPKEVQTQGDQHVDSNASQAFKKLGDALENWHRQNSKIRDAAEQKAAAQPETTKVDMADPEFEHLLDDEADGDTQALGAATDEQARALEEDAMDLELSGETRDFPLDQAKEEGANDCNEPVEDALDTVMEGSRDQPEQSRPSTFVHIAPDPNRRSDQVNQTGLLDDGDSIDLDRDFTNTHLESAEGAFVRSDEEARRLWSHYESLTRYLSLLLTEQLRLILAPTLATKMRGDFRTGKRLNIKRIIPYIASQYRRDKIWMRRSIPSKRNYQIMLAVDDSKSMGESGSGQLAFETLALVAKSLSMLEVGEICVLGFGNDVHVAHAFEKPFSSEAGARIYQHFGFQQTRTDVCRLVTESIGLFREARNKNFNAGTDLWQLELIVSDGVCEDHETIQRLVRQAQEERIMIIFVIVDALLKGESIMDMKQAIFTDGGDIQIKRYLDGFPFPYYVVVGDVRELPGVLAQALKQWFSEVVETG